MKPRTKTKPLKAADVPKASYQVKIPRSWLTELGHLRAAIEVYRRIWQCLSVADQTGILAQLRHWAPDQHKILCAEIELLDRRNAPGGERKS